MDTAIGAGILLAFIILVFIWMINGEEWTRTIEAKDPPEASILRKLGAICLWIVASPIQYIGLTILQCDGSNCSLQENLATKFYPIPYSIIGSLLSLFALGLFIWGITIIIPPSFYKISGLFLLQFIALATIISFAFLIIISLR